MATTKIERVYAHINDGHKVAWKAVTGDFALDMKGKDHKTALMFNAASGTPKVTIPVGNAIGGVGEGIEFTMATGETRLVVVDSSYFKTVSGENNGYVVGKTSASVNVAVVQLP